MLEAGRQLVGPGREHAEIVEQVIAKEKLADLFGPDDQEERAEGHLAQTDVAAEGDRCRHVVAGHDDRT